jgi:hypothetical protein
VDARREGREAAAYAYGALAVVGVGSFAAAVALGILVMTDKG